MFLPSLGESATNDVTQVRWGPTLLWNQLPVPPEAYAGIGGFAICWMIIGKPKDELHISKGLGRWRLSPEIFVIEAVNRIPPFASTLNQKRHQSGNWPGKRIYNFFNQPQKLIRHLLRTKRKAPKA